MQNPIDIDVELSRLLSKVLAKKKFIIPLLAILCFIILLIVGPIPQEQSHRSFADQRKLHGVPDFLNVITNLPFAIIALLGLKNLEGIREGKLRYIGIMLFGGFLALTFGSAYYHWIPNNNTLVLDRIPIAIILMSFVSFILNTVIDKAMELKALITLNILGIASVTYWAISEHLGRGDLRCYGMVQFFPVIAIPMILMLNQSSVEVWEAIILIFILFRLAKVCEQYDKEAFHLLGNTISGHSLKHLLMAAAGYVIVIMVRKRTNRALRAV